MILVWWGWSVPRSPYWCLDTDIRKKEEGGSFTVVYLHIDLYLGCYKHLHELEEPCMHTEYTQGFKQGNTQPYTVRKHAVLANSKAFATHSACWCSRVAHCACSYEQVVQCAVIKKWHIVCVVMNRWRVRNLAEFVPMLDSTGLDLLTKMLVYAPHRRITCQAALQHAWFSDIPEIMSKVGCVWGREEGGGMLCVGHLCVDNVITFCV